MKRLLLTGGCGFIGHHVIESVLKETDWEIIILDALTYAGDLNRIKGIPKNIADINIWNKTRDRVKFVFHDLQASIPETKHKDIGKIDYVWHLAAESHVDRSLEDSIPFVMSNVVGTANLLEYLRKYQSDLTKYIYFSTDEVFGPAPEKVFYKESDVCNPSNPYAASKEGAEAISKAFAFSHKLPVIITRTMNVFGERQHPEKFIPKTVRAIFKNEKITIHGTPQTGFSSRCWIHARNVGSALIFLTKSISVEIINKENQFDRGWGIYHIVGKERSVVDLAEIIKGVIKAEGRDYDLPFDCVDFHKTRPGHDLRYAMSGEKLAKFGYHSKLTLDEAFIKMVEWMIKEENKHWLGL